VGEGSSDDRGPGTRDLGALVDQRFQQLIEAGVPVRRRRATPVDRAELTAEVARQVEPIARAIAEIRKALLTPRSAPEGPADAAWQPKDRPPP
jgi:hypothetical protein